MFLLYSRIFIAICMQEIGTDKELKLNSFAS